jgi:hypothetical protein
MIPISTAISDPEWYRPPAGQEYYIDKRGIICGLRYEPLIVQRLGSHGCPCENKFELQGKCPVMEEYRQLLNTVDMERTLKAFNFCADKLCRPFDEEPIIVLMVHEAWNNPCSERASLQDLFHCEELRYPINDNYI